MASKEIFWKSRVWSGGQGSREEGAAAAHGFTLGSFSPVGEELGLSFENQGTLAFMVGSLK